MQRMHITELAICYGLTEASPVITQTLPTDDFHRRTKTMGRPMPCIEVKLIAPETGQDLRAGEFGEICCREYNVMKGYYNMPEATAQAFDHQGWFRSGDLGVFDADDYLSITGRSKDTIIRGGENIYPREIEEYLPCMEGMLEVQVVGVPDRPYGEQVGAFVELKSGFDLAAEDVRNFCRRLISRYKVPQYIQFISEYPLTVSGNVQNY